VAFWRRSGPDRVAEADHFLLNLAVMGGLLMIVAFGGGRIGVIDQPLPQLIDSIAAFAGAAR